MTSMTTGHQEGMRAGAYSIYAPRGLSRDELAQYLGISVAAVADWVRKGRIPGPMAGTHRWDRKAVDAALDRASGLTPAASDEPSPLQQWRLSRARSA